MIIDEHASGYAARSDGICDRRTAADPAARAGSPAASKTKQDLDTSYTEPGNTRGASGVPLRAGVGAAGRGTGAPPGHWRRCVLRQQAAAPGRRRLRLLSLAIGRRAPDGITQVSDSSADRPAVSGSSFQNAARSERDRAGRARLAVSSLGGRGGACLSDTERPRRGARVHAGAVRRPDAPSRGVHAVRQQRPTGLSKSGRSGLRPPRNRPRDPPGSHGAQGRA